MNTLHLKKLTHEELLEYALKLQYQVSSQHAFDVQEELVIKDLFKNSNDLVFVCKVFGDFLYFNDIFRQKLGYSYQELKDLNITSLLDLDYKESNFEQVKKIINVGESSVFRTAFRTKAGGILYVFGKVNCIYKNGKVTALRGIIHDVSEQVRIEDELMSQSARLNAIFQSGSHIMWTVNKQRQFTSFNKNYSKTLERQYGIRPETNTNLDHLRKALEKEEMQDIWKTHFKKAFEGEVQHFEITVSDVDGNPLWREIFLNPIPYPDGSIMEVSAIAHDITEKKMSEIVILDSENKFRSIFESFQDIYFRADTMGNITMMSPSVQELCGYSPKEMMGKHIFEYHDRITSTALKAVKNLYQHGRVKNIPAGLCCKDGSIIDTITNVRLLYDKNNIPMAMEGVIRDITERSKAAKELIKAKEIAEKSLKVKEIFLANMSHEIRTPMNGVIGMIDLLASTELSKQQYSYVQTIKKSSEILMYILNDILDISKIEAGKMSLHLKEISVLATIDKVYALFSPQADSKHNDFSYSIDKNVPKTIWADETRLIQILSNLVSNAIKFTMNGKVSIQVALLEDLGEDCKLKISIHDTGLGIHEKDLNHLFNEFDQVDTSASKSYAGTGLGLVISKNLALLMEGEIDVVSTLGAGSTFWFSFNAKKSENNITALASETITKFEQYCEGTKILVVDDNSINRKVAKEILQKMACEVGLATNGREAIEKVQNEQYDLIYMDIQMPDMDGIKTTEEIRSLNISLPPIIAMTAYAMKEDRDRFVNNGFDDYISKPIKAEKLIHTLQHWLSIDQLIIDQPIIDKDILSKLGQYGDHSFLEEILAEFIEEVEVFIGKCCSLDQKKEIKEISNIMHTIKGTAGTLGVSKIQSIAQKTEKELNADFGIDLNKRLKVLQEALKTLKQNYHNIIDEL